MNDNGWTGLCIILSVLTFFFGMIYGWLIYSPTIEYIPAEVYHSSDSHTIFSTEDGTRYVYAGGSDECPDNVPYVLNINNDTNEVIVAWRAVK